MARTLGYHVVKSGYGLWLPGDERGHWSDAWDEQIGYVEPHVLHAGDAVRQRMAAERMKHPPVRLDAMMLLWVSQTIARCCEESPWRIAAASIEPTHTHLLITYSGTDIDRTTKWLADQTTKAVHQHTRHVGPIWAKGKWCSFVYDAAYWNHIVDYIERHNIRRGVGARPYAWVTPMRMPDV
ncbi:MAG: hypothetical protein GC162_04060 [Planctomycetes bacterium]|nr:hypothetical protein [Planctomycetota bacterium]